MSALLLRFLIIVGVTGSLYGAGFVHATIRFWRATELAAVTADRDAKAESVRQLQRMASDTAERSAKLEGMKDFLQRKVEEYERGIANPQPAVAGAPAACRPAPAAGDCRLSDDDARRLRAIAAGGRDRTTR
jgi:hypothetical protein